MDFLAQIVRITALPPTAESIANRERLRYMARYDNGMSRVISEEEAVRLSNTLGLPLSGLPVRPQSYVPDESSEEVQAILRGPPNQGNNNYRITLDNQPRSPDDLPVYLVEDLTTGRSLRTHTLENIEQQLYVLNHPEIITLHESLAEERSNDNLHQQSYETLVKRLYNLPVELPEFLIVNGLRVSFIPFSEVSNIQIERYIIEPLLQPWAGPPSLIGSLPNKPINRIITIFAKNGMTHLVKAKYDQANNQIFPPV